MHWEDLHVYYVAGNSLLKGRTDLYAANFADSQIMDYRYPVFFLITFLPFCFLPYVAVKVVWLWFNYAAMILGVGAIRRGLDVIKINSNRIGLAMIFSILICTKYFIVSMQILNVHIVVLCMVFGAFYLTLKGKDVFAAVLMALAITFKIFPVLTLPYFVVKGRLRFLALTVAFVIVFNMLPAIYFGVETNNQLLKDWYNHVLVNNEFHNLNGPLNESLQGQLERYLTFIEYEKRFDDPKYVRVNFAEMSSEQVGAIAKVLSGLFALTTFLTIWFFARLRNSRSYVERQTQHSTRRFWETPFDDFAYHEFGFVICLMLLIEPRTNIYYYLAMFFPLVAFFISYFRNRTTFNIIALLLIVTISCGLPLVPGKYIQRLFLVLGVDFYLTLVLWIALGYNIIVESLNKVVARNEEKISV